MAHKKIHRVQNRYEFAISIQIRTQVFVIGQRVPALEEVDAYEDEAVHYLAWVNDTPAGAVRWRPADEYTAKIERMAVMESCRGYGLGRSLLEHVIEDLRKQFQYQWVKLGSQDHAIPFYEKSGFEVYGEGYIDAGIPHHEMVLNLSGS